MSAVPAVSVAKCRVGGLGVRNRGVGRQLPSRRWGWGTSAGRATTHSHDPREAYRQRVVIKKPASMTAKPMTRFHQVMPGIG